MEKQPKSQELSEPTSSNTQKSKSSGKRSLEEAHPFFLNLFYCFYCPLICHLKPLTDEDICNVQDSDKCDNTTHKIE
jgi:hypothetical protein